MILFWGALVGGEEVGERGWGGDGGGEFISHFNFREYLEREGKWGKQSLWLW